MTAKITPPNKADKLVYKALTRALTNNDVQIYLDCSQVNRPGSPVYNPWENLLPILGYTLLGLLIIISLNVIIGLLTIVGLLMLHTSYYQKKLHHRLLERTKQYLSTDYNHCQTLWQHGGIVLVSSDNKKQGCASPQGDWKDYTIKHFSHYMTDNNNQPESTPHETPAETESKTA